MAATSADAEGRVRPQPQIGAKAYQAAATTGGIMNDAPTRFGRTVAGRADQFGVRQLTLALPPRHAARKHVVPAAVVAARCLGRPRGGRPRRSLMDGPLGDRRGGLRLSSVFLPGPRWRSCT